MSHSTAIGCKLISLDNLHEPVELSDQKPLIIGRQKQFRIKDLNCSKQQVEITADFAKKCATVKNLGSNLSTIDARYLSENHILKEGQTLHLILDKIPYKIEFICDEKSPDKCEEKPPKKADSSKTDAFNGKRKSSNSDEQASKKKKLAEPENHDSDEDVAEKLRKMRENFAKVPVEKEERRPSPKKNGSNSANRSKTPSAVGWRKQDTLMVYKSEGVLDSAKIAAFDMDGTIITTKSGRVFPTDHHDWQILYAEIPKKLRQLHKDGYKIVFLTNQLGISRGKTTEPQFCEKAEAIIKQLGCPVHVQAGTSTGIYRKPALGTWNHLIDKENSGYDIDMVSSFYCGDAAGRPEDKSKKRKKDHSCSDRLFALNAGLRFLTPEEYFLGEKSKPFNMPDFDPKKLCENAVSESDIKKLLSKSQELIVNVGFPASGKSHFSKQFLQSAGYQYVSRDEIGTWQKCVARCQEVLKTGKSIVVDNTNPDVESRSRYVNLAKTQGVDCRCFYFPATLTHARHNEAFRQLTDKSHSKIPGMVMNSYKSKFVMPTTKEGFSEVVEVPFVAKFKNSDDEELYKLYLLEK